MLTLKCLKVPEGVRILNDPEPSSHGRPAGTRKRWRRPQRRKRGAEPEI